MYTKIQTLLSMTTAILILGFSACSKDEKGPDDQNAGKKGIQLKTDSKFGSILTDADGKTLYFFSNDAGTTSTCTGGCLAIWPVYYSAEAKTATGVNPDDIGEITRADGTKQNTYKGWPLYYYASDETAGQVNGDGVGGIWFVAKTDYSLMLVNSQLVGADTKHYTASLTEGDGSTVYFTDGNGRTLYAFSADHFNQNSFTAQDFSNDAIWPIYQSDIGSLPSAITKAAIGTITVFGKKQLTYKGWPLYYFGQDAKRGDNKGISFPKPGIWPYVNLSTSEAPHQ